MNPFSSAIWLWRAWRGRSLTFSVLCACALLGFSVLGWLRHLLRWAGLPWFAWLVVPLIVVSVVARKESEWMPDPARRVAWSRWIMLGALVLAFLFAKFTPSSPHP